MGSDFIPTAVYAGVPGSIFSAPATVTLDHGEAYVIPAGMYYLYARSADMDLEIVTATTPTWTKIADGDDAPDGFLIVSDGYNLRLKNTHASTDDETAALIKIG